MSVPSTDEPKLDDVLAFNATLLKLASAGVPIALDVSGRTEDLSGSLDKISSGIAIGMARGISLRQVLESDPELPSQYRSSLLTWLYCNESTDAFTALSDCAGGRRETERVVNIAFLQPLILLGMVYLGFLFLVLQLEPKLQAVRFQIGSAPAWGIQWLTMLRQSIWIWGTAIPLLIVLDLVIWSRHRTRWSLLRFPGRRGVFQAIQRANYAESFANLLEHEHTVEQASMMLGDFPNDNATRNMQEAETSTTRIGMPPLLKWAFGNDVSPEERATALHCSALAYRDLAQSRASEWRSWLPVLMGAILGGVLVLGFGLSLFGPMIELLTSLGRP